MTNVLIHSHFAMYLFILVYGTFFSRLRLVIEEGNLDSRAPTRIRIRGCRQEYTSGPLFHAIFALRLVISTNKFIFL